MILEKLCKSNWFIIDVDNVSIELLSWDFMIEPDTLRNIIDYFCDIRLLTRDGDKIYSQKMIDRFSWLLSKRKRDIDYRDRKPSTNVVIDVENTQSKVKESKVNKSKEKKEWTPTPTIFIFQTREQIKKEIWEMFEHERLIANKNNLNAIVEMIEMKASVEKSKEWVLEMMERIKQKMSILWVNSEEWLFNTMKWKERHLNKWDVIKNHKNSLLTFFKPWTQKK